jgi:hypothetical protein
MVGLARTCNTLRPIIFLGTTVYTIAVGVFCRASDSACSAIIRIFHKFPKTLSFACILLCDESIGIIFRTFHAFGVDAVGVFSTGFAAGSAVILVDI